MATFLEVIVFVVMATYVLICPYTKVEESFNTQAIHDILYHQINLSQYDHLEFPGVVPRTFLGPLMVALVSAPLVTMVTALQLTKLWSLIIDPDQLASEKPAGRDLHCFPLSHSNVGYKFIQHVRCVLGCMVLAGLYSFSNAIEEKFGKRVKQLLMIITASQFHFMFYMSRPLPNTFALSFVLLSLACWLRGDHTKFLWFSGIAIVIFRAELGIYLGQILVLELVTQRLTVGKLLKVGVPAGILILGITCLVDSYFWQRWLWPEGEVLWFNAVLNKSSQWGTSPFSWYFTSALPRALSVSIVLVPVGLYLSPPVRTLLLPAGVFVFLYSFLPHKELRFIIYVIPVCNVAVAYSVNRLWQNKDKSLFRKLLAIGAVLHILGNIATTGVFLYSSYLNYPGGEAIYRLHQLEPSTKDVHVHIDVATAQTGVSRFLQFNQEWRYNKTEDLKPGGDIMMSYTHIVTGNSSHLAYYKHSHDTLDTVSGFVGISKNRQKLPILYFKTDPKIWILARKRK